MFHTYFRLEIANYITLPSASFDTMMKFSRVKLDQILDAPMIKLSNDSLRVEICFLTSKYEKAHNEYRQNNSISLNIKNIMGVIVTIHKLRT
jgi:hypothetical protein